jgi:RNA polymerase sigma-70 factor, ECF subfamily
MRATWPMQFVGLLGFCLLSVPLTVAVWTRPQEPPRLPAAPPAPRRPYRSRTQEALRAGWWFWMLAHQAAHEELEALEQRAVAPLAAADREQCRRQLLAMDRSGDLRQAAAKAERAVALAQTLAETYEATMLRAVAACELGHHRAELKQAQTLMKLAPRNPVSLMYLRRAALCNGLQVLAEQATTRLASGRKLWGAARNRKMNASPAVSYIGDRRGARELMVGVREPLAMREPEGKPATDWALIQRALAGERSALEALLGPHQPSLVGLCFGILGHTEDAEDAAQETFLHALRSLASFRGDSAFRSWLFRIAINICATRKRSQRWTEPWDEERSRQLSSTSSPEVIALRRLHMSHLLHRLLPRQRAILLLREWEGWSLAEIAEAMGWNEIRVRNELYKARRALIEARRQDEGES